MLRTLFAPRLVVLHLLVVGVLVAFAFLGRWQLAVFEESGRPLAAADPAPVAVESVSRVGQRLTSDLAGRQVFAQGAYDAAAQLLVADRLADVEAPGGRVSSGAGFWLLTPLRLADGSTVAVVRGWVASPQDPAVAVPSGSVRVTGRLRPPDQSDAVQRGGALPEGQVATVSTAQLINLWDGPLHDGFLVAVTQDPALTATPVAVPPPTQGAALTWRNLAYAAQWWIFALFAVFMWWHFVRDAVRAGRKPPVSLTDPGAGTGSEPDSHPEPVSR
ncbi:SURF1-like protein [Acrocarpospora phusangensis]|uniref:SURF1-like protein n=1 Tax=Acrocarpospora phusangensis TaxID=1070424 RepID=A0A919UPX1_9ACTN|nr:SURF1 family protein [Acrocarpospora phusangensis]GIH26192.1 SURF1-like protein [Acrocarpospora phusangensis]